MALAYYVLGWSGDAAKIAGIALSTTSLAVVYAVLVETGLNRTVIGKRLMSATFITDFATAAALSILFITPTSGSSRSRGLGSPRRRDPARLALVLRALWKPRDRA